MDQPNAEPEANADAEAEGMAQAKAEPNKPSKADKLEAKLARLRAAEQAEQERPSPPGAPLTGRWRITLVALSAAVVALGAVLAGTLVKLADRNDELTATRAAADLAAVRDSALVAAQKYAVDFGSYDYQHLERDFDRVTAHLTPSFAKSYASISAKLQDVIVQYKGRSTATVQGAAVSQVSPESATVLVFLDQKVTTAQSDAPRIDRNRLQLSLVRSADGTWLISDLALK